MGLNMKTYFTLLCLLAYPVVSVANVENLDRTQLIGKWSCFTSFKVNDLHITELSDSVIQADGITLQKGMTSYKSNKEEAIFKYDMTSNWVLVGNNIKFSHLKVKDYSINNKDFDQKYNISTKLLDLVDKENNYKILKMTDKEMVMSPEGYDIQEVCRKQE